MLIRPKFKILLILLLLITEFVPAQNYINSSRLKSKFVIKENKDRYYKNLENNIKITFGKDILENINDWEVALKNAESILFKNKFVKSALKKSLSLPVDKFLKLQRTSLEAAYALYGNGFNILINNIWVKTNDKTSYAISTNYLISSNYKNRDKAFYSNDLKLRFKNFNNSSLLRSLYFDLTVTTKEKFDRQPSLSELLNHVFQKGKTIVYSFHRKNRKYPGITIIRKPDGTFVKNSTGEIFNIPQLALSYSNLPGYIPNGNTPEGIYSIIGWYISPTETIGPTPNILVRSPFEVTPDIFFHGNNQHKIWNINDYESLLPDSWKNYFPIYQSYYAGKSGRRLIIMHGSTDELKFFENQPYFPLTPTRGCLSSKEIWDEQTGKCLESDQVKLINAFKSTGQKKGFLVVVEIDDKNEPVTSAEIKTILNK